MMLVDGLVDGNPLPGNLFLLALTNLRRGDEVHHQNPAVGRHPPRSQRKARVKVVPVRLPRRKAATAAPPSGNHPAVPAKSLHLRHQRSTRSVSRLRLRTTITAAATGTTGGGTTVTTITRSSRSLSRCSVSVKSTVLELKRLG